MRRRDFLSRIGLVGVTPVLVGTGCVYGFINRNNTLRKHVPFIASHSWMTIMNTLVYLDGQEVTKRCYGFFAASGRGYVQLFKVDKRGNFYYDHSIKAIARETKFGQIEVKQKEVSDA